MLPKGNPMVPLWRFRDKFNGRCYPSLAVYSALGRKRYPLFLVLVHEWEP